MKDPRTSEKKLPKAAVKVHPVIARLEGTGKAAAVLLGYPGKARDGSFRLYRDLDMSAYAEVPLEAVLHSEEGEDGGPTRLYVLGDAALTETVVSDVNASLSRYRESFPVDFERVRYETFASCAGKCEGKLLGPSWTYHQLLANAGNAPPEIGHQLYILANQIKELNREVLHDCLAACPRPIFGSRQETEDALMEKHFG